MEWFNSSVATMGGCVFVVNLAVCVLDLIFISMVLLLNPRPAPRMHAVCCLRVMRSRSHFSGSGVGSVCVGCVLDYDSL